MPAAAEIPAPIALINVAAVKKLVVGSRVQAARCTSPVPTARRSPSLPPLFFPGSRRFWRGSAGGWGGRRGRGRPFLAQPLPGRPPMLLAECPGVAGTFTLKKLECSKQALPA